MVATFMDHQNKNRGILFYEDNFMVPLEQKG